ncbi:MAG: DUF1211 domain-containing protein [Actinobacteria bacterium]|nr:DUF1211 domain-containing protein [Actinomycetota bacterium]
MWKGDGPPLGRRCSATPSSGSRSRCWCSTSGSPNPRSTICGAASCISGPPYLAYVTSFITIGGWWLAHHGIFRRLQYANNEVMRLNLLLLMAVAFLPFPTRLLAEAIRDADAERAAVIFYGGTLLVISLLFSALWGMIARNRDLLRPDVDEKEINAILLATTPSIGFYVAVMALAIVAPQLAAFGFVLIAIVGVLRARGEEEATLRSG